MTEVKNLESAIGLIMRNWADWQNQAGYTVTSTPTLHSAISLSAGQMVDDNSRQILHTCTLHSWRLFIQTVQSKSHNQGKVSVQNILIKSSLLHNPVNYIT